MDLPLAARTKIDIIMQTTGLECQLVVEVLYKTGWAILYRIL